MFIVMMLGMMLLGAAFGEFHGLVFGSGFADAWRDHVGLAAFAMGFNMTVPMVLWMRYYRGHSWERGAEMALAMTCRCCRRSSSTGSGRSRPRACSGCR